MSIVTGVSPKEVGTDENVEPPVASTTAAKLSMQSIRLLAAFFLGQGLNQAIGLLAGFLILRWLSVQDYAKFSLAFGFQVVMTSLMDLGVSGSIVNLVGPRGNDKSVIGDYIAATRWLRNRLFLLLVPGGGLAFHYYALNHGWGANEQLVLYSSIVVTIFFQVSGVCYCAPLVIHRQLSAYYRIAALSAAGRLTAVVLIYYAATLTASVIYIVTALSAALTSVLARRVAKSLMLESARVRPEICRELLRYVGPLAPGIIFFAFQGKITIFLVSVIGTTQSVAEIGALGRIGLLFGALTALNGAVILPYFARIPDRILASRYFIALGVAVACGVLAVVLASLWPEPLLWLLGPKYMHMKKEVIWVVVASSFEFIGALMYGIHLARKWVFWWASLLAIIAVICAQSWMLWQYAITSTLAAAMFAAVTSIVLVLVQLPVAVKGFHARSLT